MHALSYAQKRGHLSAVALGRQMFKRVPAMTPARFDVLHIIYANARWGRGEMTPQAELRRRLGLTRQTIWRMVERLVELGLLEQWRNPYDRRQIDLQLTSEGLQRIRQAYGAAFSERYPVPLQDDGTEAPRHAYRLVRDEAKKHDRIEKIMAPHRRLLPAYLQKSFWPSLAPKKIGREVAKVFTSFARNRAGSPTQRQRLRTRAELETMVHDTRALAKALGDTSDAIYPYPPVPPWLKELRSLHRRRPAQPTAATNVAIGPSDKPLPSFELQQRYSIWKRERHSPQNLLAAVEERRLLEAHSVQNLLDTLAR